MTPNTLQLAKALVTTPYNDSNATTITRPKEERLNRRRALSKAITLIESRSVDHIHQGDLLLNYLIEARKSKEREEEEEEKQNCTTGEIKLKNNNNQFRIGIAGSPGAGKINVTVGFFFRNKIYYSIKEKKIFDSHERVICI